MYDRRPSTVYAVRCKENGKVYIGCTMDVELRMSAHISDLKSGRKAKKSPAWQEDFNKYGVDAFQLYILEENVPYNRRRVREHLWIEEYRSTDPAYGYNRDRMEMVSQFAKEKGLPPKMEEKV